VELQWIRTDGVTRRDLTEIHDLLRRSDGFCWLDIPLWSDEAEQLLAKEFHFHPMALGDCRERNHIPRVHVYPNHVFIVVHAPEIGTGGHVHYLELDQFIGANYLVTVHGPLNPKVSLDTALRETRSAAERLEKGRLKSTSPVRPGVRDHLLDRPPRVRPGG
jgi:Mg2+ and Co2+ transporter CorA